MVYAFSIVGKELPTAVLVISNFCIKETKRILISLIPVYIWLLLFNIVKFIPTVKRRPIDVNTLYKIEKKLGSFCFKFYKDQKEYNIYLDLLAWLPYGVCHYIMPFLVSYLLIRDYPSYYFSAYIFFFGLMNLIGVLTQIAWPTSPPWYYVKRGTNPANYSMYGDPAGLQRIDNLFHGNIYTKAFANNPLPWGAWPSLHSGFASYTALFFSFIHPNYSLLFFLYVIWIWWATMYLGHHYFIDIIGGFAYAFICALGSTIYLSNQIILI
jgi:membrane-associated phospholipid phosphatase